MTEAEIQQEIERTRERLGATVTELAAKADVPARARNKVADVRSKARSAAAGLAGQVRPSQLARRRWPLAVAAVTVMAAASAVLWQRRKA